MTSLAIVFGLTTLLLSWGLAICIKRLFQFDSAFSLIASTLTEYAIDLQKLSSADLLQDNPEVLHFHKRNRKALEDIEGIIKMMTNGKSAEQPKEKLPPPDVV